MADTVGHFTLAQAMDMHDREIREAHRRTMRLRSDLEAAQEDHAAAIEGKRRFVEFVNSANKNGVDSDG